MRGITAIIVAAATAVFGCVAQEPGDIASQEAELIGGTVDDGDPAVISLSTTSSFSFCTGTLISPSVVATAAHCIAEAGGDPNITAFFGTDVMGDGRKVAVSQAVPHPQYSGCCGAYDIALMRLQFAQEPDLPIPLNREPLDDYIGATVRRVGFGIYTTDGDFDNTKREGTTTIARLETLDVVIAGDSELSTCSGDSGGPLFLEIDGVEHIAGVHSYGSQSNGVCIPGNDGDTRVDIYADTFVQAWVDENDPGCGADGTCYPVGCSDDPDCTPCGPDGNCTEGCPLPDVDCTTQEVGELCRADTQCVSGSCVFWAGDPNTRFCTRTCDPANDDCPDGMSCQNVQNEGDICYYDEPPDGVLGDACELPTDCGSYQCEDGACVVPCDLGAGMGCPADFECAASSDGSGYYCFGVGGGGGCSATGSATGAWWLLLGVALALRRRRSRGGRAGLS